jgi:hypothetical protein
MVDKPLIFSAPMIRALLDGRKTQTRRVLKSQPCIRPELHEPMNGDPFWCVFDGDEIAARVRVPYAPGDRLWVREAHRIVRVGADQVSFRAESPDTSIIKWRSPIHMPRWASRLTLIVTDVRVQRLQEIGIVDAYAEGVVPADLPLSAPAMIERNLFSDLWNSLHGPDAWDANPWVAAITFTVHKCNIDAMRLVDHGL